MPLFKNCCCCISLRVGGIVMGVTTTVLSVFSLIPSIWSLLEHVNLARIVTHLLTLIREGNGGKHYNPMELWGTVADVVGKGNTSGLPPADDPNVVWLADAMQIFFTIEVVILSIYLVCSIFLIVGAIRASRWFILPWLLMTFVLLMGYVAGMILTVYMLGSNAMIVLLFVVALVETVVAFYVWLCIVSLFQVLGSDDFQDMNEYDMKIRSPQKYYGVNQEVN